ncbi:hypothetical protein Pyn_04686 [Prunus yedoensis var. nudiflora]|uniref:Uncharacterized protein n=1 Tax=Prunus yedoensis var. nudiflora TaxID=2094558 RepID=A0A314XL62_PRUYE|nr:hypothetical protein Pyn_04686 [Prunus yedoensis var. nudiflora]
MPPPPKSRGLIAFSLFFGWFLRNPRGHPYHPDVSKDSQAEEVFKSIRQAYEIGNLFAFVI